MKLLKKIDSEVLLGGIFGAIAIVAILIEMLLGDFEAAAVAGGIKDIAGTVVGVMVFAIAAKAIFKKEDTSFHAVFTREMEDIENKYMPLLARAEANGDDRRAQKLAEVVRYELSTNIDALMDGDAKNYASFFEFDISSPDKISFFINKTTFMGRSPESFDPLRKEITLKIENGILRRYAGLGKGLKRTANGFEISFEHVLKTKEDARMLADLVDNIMLLYIAVCKK